MGMQCAPCIASQSVLFPSLSRLITTHTSTTAAIANKSIDQAANKDGLWCDREWKRDQM